MGSVVYVHQGSNLNTLFTNIYSKYAYNIEKDAHRPKSIGLRSKQWDSIANKTFCLDFTKTSNC